MASLFHNRASTRASTSNVSPKLTKRPRLTKRPKLTKRPIDIKQLNDSVWEFYKPLNGDRVPPKLELLFFHGAQLVNDPDIFWKTWLSRDGDVVWPTTWLAQQFPEARILFISYDSSLRKFSGQKDTYQTTENLMQDMIWSSTCKAGQRCPVIFVGHCFGGVILKDFLIKCSEYTGRRQAHEVHVKEIKMFLKNCKAVFFYSTPNAGSRLMDGLAYRDYVVGSVHKSVVDILEILSHKTARINSKFNELRHSQNPVWVTRGIAENLKTRLSNSRTTMVIPEASARQDLDHIYWANADHFDVSKAKDNLSCNIFTGLRDLVADYYNMSQNVTPPLPFGSDNKYVPLVDSINRVRKALENGHECHVVTVCGEPGLGKTSLVKYIALQYQPHHTPQGSVEAHLSTVFPHGVIFLPCGQGRVLKLKELQQNMLQSLGCGSEAVPDDIPQESDGDYMSIPTFRRRLQFKLRNLKALVILDDVWERPVAEELILSQDEAPFVKYLLTSQFADVWPDAVTITMERPSLEEARKILLKYTKGLSTTNLPENIEGLADSLIEHADYHPLVLANLGLGFRQEEAQEPEAWRRTRDAWEHEPPIEESYKPLIYGRGYPLALDKTMTRIIEVSLDDHAKDVLFLISALSDSLLGSGFRSGVPETALKYLYKCANSGKMSGYRSAITHLQNSSLVDCYSYRYGGGGTDLVIHRLRALSVRSQFPSQMQVVIGRALQPVREMYDRHIAQMTPVGALMRRALQSLRGIYNHHSPQMPLIGARHNDSANVNDGLLNATMVGMYIHKRFLVDARAEIPRTVDYAVDDLLKTSHKNEIILRYMVELLHADPSGEEWKQEANLCAKKIIVKFACRHELDDESVGRLIQLPQTSSTTLYFLTSCFSKGYWWMSFFEHNKTFSSAHSQSARILYGLVHDATSIETLDSLITTLFGSLHCCGMLDYEDDDTIMNMGEPLIKLALRENANINPEWLRLQKFPSSESRSFRVIEKKIPDLWKAMLTVSVRKQLPSKWFSSPPVESNAASTVTHGRGVLESLCGRVDYYLYEGTPYPEILERLSSLAENGKHLSASSQIMETLVGTLRRGTQPDTVELVGVEELFDFDVARSARVLRNLALSQDIREKILSCYPGIVETLEHWEQNDNVYDTCGLEVSRAIGVLHTPAVRIKISDYNPAIRKWQLGDMIEGRLLGYYDREMYQEFLAVTEEDLFPKDIKQIFKPEIIVAKAMLEQYSSALTDAHACVLHTHTQVHAHDPSLSVVLGLRGTVRLLSGQSLPEALADFDTAVDLSRAKVSLAPYSYFVWRENGLATLMYYLLKQRGLTKHLMRDDTGARQDAKEAQQLQFRNLVWDEVSWNNHLLDCRPRQNLLLGVCRLFRRPVTYLGFNFTF